MLLFSQYHRPSCTLPVTKTHATWASASMPMREGQAAHIPSCLLPRWDLRGRQLARARALIWTRPYILHHPNRDWPNRQRRGHAS